MVHPRTLGYNGAELDRAGLRALYRLDTNTCHFAKHPVAGGVPVAIVDELEVIVDPARVPQLAFCDVDSAAPSWLRSRRAISCWQTRQCVRTNAELLPILFGSSWRRDQAFRQFAAERAASTRVEDQAERPRRLSDQCTAVPLPSLR
jgi:hypothetical protein